MKYKLLKALYRLYKKDVLDIVVEDFYSEIPDNVREPAISILEERKKKIDQWLLYQAYYLQRRISKTRQGVDNVFGMLLQLKLTRHMLSQNEQPQEKEEQPKQKEEEKKDSTLEDNLISVEEFLNRGVEK